jgi:hypothetical protein
MIDTDKYEGHTPAPWRIEYGDMEQYGETDTVLSGIDVVALDVMRQDAQLIADAPLLLAEVKRLRKQLSEAEDVIQYALDMTSDDDAKNVFEDFLKEMIE